jgi:hypothetical protein
MEQVAVAMTLFELIEFLLIFSDHPWVVYLWHDFIVPLMKWIGITRPLLYEAASGQKLCRARQSNEPRYLADQLTSRCRQRAEMLNY